MKKCVRLTVQIGTATLVCVCKVQVYSPKTRESHCSNIDATKYVFIVTISYSQGQ